MGKLKEILSILKLLWNPPKERLLVRSLLAGCLLTLAIFVFATVQMLRPVAASKSTHHVEHAENEAAKEGGEEGHKEIKFGQNPIPKSIRERQTGVMEEGHDLVDPEIKSTRNLASKLKEEEGLIGKVPYRFVELPEVMAGTRAGVGFTGKVLATVALEVDSYEAEQEVIRRKTEFKGVVDSLISEHSLDSLKTPKGVTDLKVDIQREINHLLKGGQVSDVLFPQFFIM